MDASEYHELARTYEQQALSNPTQYRAGLRRFALLGRMFPLLYAASVLIVAIMVVAAIAQFGGAGIVIAKVGWIVIPLLFVALRSLFVRVPAPEGLRIERKDAPALFDMIEELSERASTAPPDRVLITDDFNAAVAEIPRLAMIGGFRRYLLIGMPMMAALSPDELRSVIAHELGHVSGRHGRDGVLVFRVFEGWRRLWDDIDGKGGSGPLLRFGRWYLPRLQARSFALRRQQEVEADELARDLVGGEVAATAMLRVFTESARSERFASELWQQRVADGEIGEGWVQMLMRRFRAPLQRPERARVYLVAQLLEESGTEDEHPALADRLRTFGSPVAVRPGDPGASLDDALRRIQTPPATTAARHYLGTKAEALAATLDGAALEQARQSLQMAREDDGELRRLEGQEDAPRDLELLLKRLSMSMALRPPERVAELTADLLEQHPASAIAHFHRGSYLLSENDPAGVHHLHRAMELDPASTDGVCGTLRAWHVARGEFEQADEVERRGRTRAGEEAAAAAERASLDDQSPLDPPALPEGCAAALREIGAREPNITGISVARRRVEHLPQEPAWLIGLRLADGDQLASIAETLFEAMAPATLGVSACEVALLGPEASALRIEQVEGSELYQDDAALQAR